jgi:hypothetical protein
LPRISTSAAAEGASAGGFEHHPEEHAPGFLGPVALRDGARELPAKPGELPLQARRGTCAARITGQRQERLHHRVTVEMEPLRVAMVRREPLHRGGEGAEGALTLPTASGTLLAPFVHRRAGRDKRDVT